MLLQILLFLLVFVVTRKLWKRWKYDLHKIPSPPSLPVLGHTLEFGGRGKSFSKWFRTRHKQLGCPKLIRFDVAMDTWIFVMDPDLIRTEVNHRTDPLPRHPLMKNAAAPIICSSDKMKDTLLSTNNKQYAKQIREAYFVGLSTSQMKKRYTEVKAVMNKMIQIIEFRRQNGPIEFQKLCVEVSLDIIGVIAMDTQLGGLDGTWGIYEGILETGRMGRELMMMPHFKLYCKLFPNSKIATDFKRVSKTLKEEWTRLTNDILERPDPPEGETPIWYNLKTMIDPDTNKPLPFDMLRSEIAAVVFGGMDTSGHQLAWILAMLATHPTIAEKLVTELREHGLYGPNAREVTVEEVGTLPYLNAVVKEGFRVVHIVSFGAPRQLPRDMTLFGYRLPKGTVVDIPGNRCINNEAEWGDPDVVRPERWLQGEDMSNKFFDMFQVGPRACPGQKLSMFEIRLALLTILSKYKLSTDKSFQCFLDNEVEGAVIECKGGIWLNVTPRNPDE